MSSLNKRTETYSLTFGKHTIDLELLEDHLYWSDPDKDDTVLTDIKFDGKDIRKQLDADENYGTSDRDFWGEILIDLGLITEIDYGIDYIVPEFLRGRV